jgi:hypothetical protein
MSPKNRLHELRQKWAKPIERPRPLDAIELFHREIAKAGDRVDDHTWEDLGLTEVFAAMDRSAGMPGRQVLYHQLRMYVTDAAVLAERARQHEIFRRESSLREQIQLLMERLDRPGAEYVAPFLLGRLPPRPRLAWIFPVLSAVTAAALVGTFFFHPLLLVALPFLLINSMIYSTYGQSLAPHFSGFAQINSLLGVAVEVGQISDGPGLPQIAALRQSRPLIDALRRRLGWLVMDRSTLPDFYQAVFGYLNMCFLLDVVVFLRSVHLLEQNRAALVQIFEAVGSLDAAIAVASYLEGLPAFTLPELGEHRRIEVTGLYHPLIPHPVENAFSLNERSALITGPNMAGKTAFIRAVGINLILAQTLGFCLARSAVLPRSVVQSSIRREDRLSDGESYFFTEIKQVRDFIEDGQKGRRHVFLIDEIFRGTNTIERIASAAAVLRYLAQENIVLATTHDVELQRMLADTYAMHHFSDRVVDGKYGFDYLIHPGPVRSRNAIKLLALSGYPAAVTEEARRLAAELEAVADQHREDLPSPTPADGDR